VGRRPLHGRRGANFVLLYAALRRLANPFRDEEFRLYLVLLVLGTAALVARLAARGTYEGEEALRHAAFQAASMMTTTGYASADFAEWPVFTGMVLVALMFVGGSAGSAAGAIKVVRLLVLTRVLRRELDQTVRREAIVPLRLNGAVLDERTISRDQGVRDAGDVPARHPRSSCRRHPRPRNAS
jgi:trk system potassium uptake protein TrkH